jgi:hypothetical protein
MKERFAMNDSGYTVKSEGNGQFVTVTREADGATLFMQGDDADKFLSAWDGCSANGERLLCDSYSEQFTQAGA